jgi:hypothetical protein
MKSELLLSFVGVAVLGFLFALSAFLINTRLAVFMSLFAIIVGSSMTFFGFWGADFAFAVALGQLDQSGEEGKVKGVKGAVYVPFMKNYTPLEWWNLNWVVVAIGSAMLALGCFIMGLLLR